MRHFAARAFQILQREEDLGSSSWRQLTSVEIIDDQGRMAYVRCRAVGSGVEITIKVNDGPTLSVGDIGRVAVGDIQIDDSADTRQAAFASYWDSVDADAAVLGSTAKVAREAFMAGLAHRDTGQSA